MDGTSDSQKITFTRAFKSQLQFYYKANRLIQNWARFYSGVQEQNIGQVPLLPGETSLTSQVERARYKTLHNYHFFVATDSYTVPTET